MCTSLTNLILFFYVTLFVKRPLGTKGLISRLDVWFPK
jgi:hypothetical protein